MKLCFYHEQTAYEVNNLTKMSDFKKIFSSIRHILFKSHVSFSIIPGKDLQKYASSRNYHLSDRSLRCRQYS